MPFPLIIIIYTYNQNFFPKKRQKIKENILKRNDTVPFLEEIQVTPQTIDIHHYMTELKQDRIKTEIEENWNMQQKERPRQTCVYCMYYYYRQQRIHYHKWWGETPVYRVNLYTFFL